LNKNKIREVIEKYKNSVTSKRKQKIKLQLNDMVGSRTSSSSSG